MSNMLRFKTFVEDFKKTLSKPGFLPAIIVQLIVSFVMSALIAAAGYVSQYLKNMLKNKEANERVNSYVKTEKDFQRYKEIYVDENTQKHVDRVIKFLSGGFSDSPASGSKFYKGGVCFAGPGGTGKTSLAGYIAGKTGAHVIKVSENDLINNPTDIRRIYKKAVSLGKCIIVIDDIVEVAAGRSTDIAKDIKTNIIESACNGGKNIAVISSTNNLSCLRKVDSLFDDGILPQCDVKASLEANIRLTKYLAQFCKKANEKQVNTDEIVDKFVQKSGAVRKYLGEFSYRTLCDLLDEKSSIDVGLEKIKVEAEFREKTEQETKKAEENRLKALNAGEKALAECLRQNFGEIKEFLTKIVEEAKNISLNLQVPAKAAEKSPSVQ